jgi:Eco57I restriction-modification methylase
MTDRGQWLIDMSGVERDSAIDGLVLVRGYKPDGRPPEEAAMMEKAKAYRAHAVFFEAGRNGRPPIAQAFIFVSDGPANDPEFAELHKRLWSWAGVPLLYRKTRGLVQLFRCAHKPDFYSTEGELICNPVKTLDIASAISTDLWGDTYKLDPWWDASRLRNGTLWDDPVVSKVLLSSGRAAHKRLVDAVKELNDELNEGRILKKHLRRKLLILSLLIAYLEARSVLLPSYFGQFLKGATKFFQVLGNGRALVDMLTALEDKFNGNVFVIDDADRESLRNNGQLARFARLIEARQEKDGQLNLWELYSFKDLPVEVISHIYQLFVTDSATSIYTPPFLVRLMLDETLSWERLDRLQQNNEIILDPSCGSGVFLVEAYKRLVLHWRSRNHWKRPRITVLKSLLKKVRGIDLEAGAVELAAFSLCLALCDALEPETIRSSIKLLPPLQGKTLHRSCFFEAKEQNLIKEPIGAVVGNPPFASSLNTLGAERSYKNYEKTHGSLPDKQLAYLFLHEAMGMIAEGGVLGMLQQYNFLYNQGSLSFRRNFIAKWDVREVLDFISVRGLFQKGGADTKVIVVVAEAATPLADRKILHATFRRSGRADAEQGFDIDYYDLHWLSRDLVMSNDGVWRANLFGGGRVLGFLDRLRKFRTLGEYAEAQGWDYGEGFIEARPKEDPSGSKARKLSPAEHLTGKPLLPSSAITDTGINKNALSKVDATLFKSAYTAERYSPPMTLIHQQFDLHHDYWNEGYLTYKNQIVGFCGSPAQAAEVQAVSSLLKLHKRPLQAFVAGTSVKLFTQHATTLSAVDVISLPYPQNGDLDLSSNEQILVDDIVDYYRDFIRLGEDSAVMKEGGYEGLPDFTSVFTRQINAVYGKKPLVALEPQTWLGVICQPFVFGKGRVDWSGADQLEEKLNTLLLEQQGTTLFVTRIARIYDGSFIFLVKPDRLRYWLRSVALRDADETLADLRAQGF